MKRLFSILLAITMIAMISCKKDKDKEENDLMDVIVFMNYVYQDEGVYIDICAVSPDDSRKVTLLPWNTNCTGSCEGEAPFWFKQPQLSPDGTKLLVNDDDNFNIFEYNLVSKTMRAIYSEEDYNAETPVYNHDGTKITFFNRSDFELQTVNIDGSGKFPYLVEDEKSLVYPSYTPDGSKLVVKSWEYDILSVMNSDGSEYSRIIEATKDQKLFHPKAISNSQLIYVLKETKNAICVASLDGTEIKKVYESTDDLSVPSLSSSGEKICFMIGDNENARFYVGDFDGSRVTGLQKLQFQARVHRPSFGKIKKSIFDAAPDMDDVAPPQE